MVSTAPQSDLAFLQTITSKRRAYRASDDSSFLKMVSEGNYAPRTLLVCVCGSGLPHVQQPPACYPPTKPISTDITIARLTLDAIQVLLLTTRPPPGSKLISRLTDPDSSSVRFSPGPYFNVTYHVTLEEPP
eukprot:g2867.t1